jgi:hypothetical protein
MILTKEELIAKLNNEVRILLHLVSKVDPAYLDYRPSPTQRSMLELLQYLTIFAPIHLRTIKAGVLDMKVWSNEWTTEEAVAKERGLEEIRSAISKQPELFTEMIEPLTDADLRTEMEMFGNRDCRGSMLVWMLLCHYAAYRMQLFLYLKACGRHELSTYNVWAGVDKR